MFQWFDYIGIDGLTNAIRSFFLPYKPFLYEWFYYSLPDGIWIFSFTTTLIIYWDFCFEKVKIWLLIPFFLGIIFEILQSFYAIFGTFDVFDLLCSIVGFLLSFIFLKIKPKYKNHESFVS
jgi:hypothetical protein